MVLSVIILANNEEKTIEGCLKSVRFADEIVVIDDYSTDKTVEIAKKYGAIVFQRKLDDFASQRNFGLLKASGTCKFFIDADERISNALRREIQNRI